MKAKGSLAQRLVQWQLRDGRHDLPWQNTTDAYRIWLSEIMLQQTQVVTVIDYYARFLKRFPTVFDLAAASQDEVLALWAGLGYYSRARNLHACAQRVVNEFGGVFPNTPEALITLPGIGASTAAAIAVFAYAYPAPILDGNVKRILSRAYGITNVPSAQTDKLLWQKAHETLVTVSDAKQLEIPFEQALRAYTQGVMDLGANVCRRAQADCDRCPWQADCWAYQNDHVAQIPAPKARTEVKTLQVDWYIYRHGNRVWLQQQPEKGIWAKLWVFPTNALFESDAAINQLTRISHRLTHRLLHIQPYWVELTEAQAKSLERMGNATGQWLAIDEERLELALPKPAEQLLRTLFDQNSLL